MATSPQTVPDWYVQLAEAGQRDASPEVQVPDIPGTILSRKRMLRKRMSGTDWPELKLKKRSSLRFDPTFARRDIGPGFGLKLPAADRLTHYELEQKLTEKRLRRTTALVEETLKLAQTRTSPFVELRFGFAIFFILLTFGLFLSSFALTTNAGPLVKGIAVFSIWAGQAVLAITAHVGGRKSGEYLFSKPASWPLVVLTVGMVLVAVVATIEFSIAAGTPR